MALARWDPIHEMARLRNLMDRLSEEGFWRPFYGEGEVGVPVDVIDRGEEYRIEVALPGIRPEDVDVTVGGNTLTIRGQYKEPAEAKDYLLHERRAGSFARSLTLPATLDAEHANAQFADGVLTLTVPKASEARPRRIQVRHAEALAPEEQRKAA